MKVCLVDAVQFLFRKSFVYCGFIDIKNWYKSVIEQAPDDVKKILIGNKSDGHKNKRTIGIDRGRQLARELRMDFLEVSAQSGQGVERLFFNLAR